MFSKYYDTMLKPYDLFDTFSLFNDVHRPIKNFSTYRVGTDEGRLEFSIDLPGVKANDLSVQTTGRLIQLTGKIRGEDFKKVYTLSKDYDPDTIDASLADGVLTLRFDPIAESKPKTIQVKVS